jgi:hypothetical protein
MSGLSNAFLLSLGQPVPLVLYESFWIALPPDRLLRQSIFNRLYALEIVTIDEQPFVSFVNQNFWTYVTIFRALPGAACVENCSYKLY